MPSKLKLALKHPTEEAKLILMLESVVEDFLPNIGNCVLQDYGMLNDALIALAKWKKENPDAQ